MEGTATGKMLLSIRPEHLKMITPNAENSGSKEGRVVGQAFKGHYFTYQVEVEGQSYFVQTDSRCSFQVDDTVQLRTISAVAVDR